MLPFLAAVFLGAFLLFLVQPLMGRFILPWQGGAPAVWTACLLFFQAALLVGYLYAHLLCRYLTVRRQLGVHLGLLAGALLWMPPVPDLAGNDAARTLPPVLQVLLLLAQTVGPPFVLLAGSGPLLQRWFAERLPERSPYRLYALSNAGSLLALFAYPLLLEPWFTRQTQTHLWTGLYLVFGGAVGLAARRFLRARLGPPAAPPVADASRSTRPPEAPPGAWRCLVWMLWAAAGTGLLAATTQALTLDVAAVPFLWIAPLAVYLGSLILAFDHPRWYHRELMALLLPLAMASSLDLRIFGSTVELRQLLTTHLFALGTGTLLCHGELFRSRPAPRHLTGFYLSLAAGGVLGTLATAVISPLLLERDIDLPLLWSGLLLLAAARWTRRRDLRAVRAWSLGLLLALALVPALRPTETAAPGWTDLWTTYRDLARHTALLLVPLVALLALLHLHPRQGWVRAWSLRTTGALWAIAAVIGAFIVGTALQPPPGTVASRRSFFGEISVVDHAAADPRSRSRFLAHGSTTHGIGFLHPDLRRYPTSYYSAQSGIGRVFTRANQRAGRRIGVVGLGVGTIASYGMAGDHLVFFEIDPHMIELARDCFHFLADSAARIDLRLGDGRRLLATEAGQPEAPRYDILVLDAFSSDSVPVHLLTREAFAIYLQRLDPRGVLVVNVSNRLVDLRPVLEHHARHFGLHFAHLIHRPEPADWWDFSSEWIVLAPQRAALDTPAITSWTGIAAPGDLAGVPWTDDFASLLPILR